MRILLIILWWLEWKLLLPLQGKAVCGPEPCCVHSQPKGQPAPMPYRSLAIGTGQAACVYVMVHTWMCVIVYMYVIMYTCMYNGVLVCVCNSIHVCKMVYTCMCVCMYVCVTRRSLKLVTEGISVLDTSLSMYSVYLCVFSTPLCTWYISVYL